MGGFQHPRFRIGPRPPATDPDALIRWVCESAATLIAPPKVDGEDCERTCDEVADEVRRLAEVLVALPEGYPSS